jgi:hypothetical protein
LESYDFIELRGKILRPGLATISKMGRKYGIVQGDKFLLWNVMPCLTQHATSSTQLGMQEFTMVLT